MFQPDGADLHLMILEKLPDVWLLELDRIVAYVDLVLRPGVKGGKGKAYND